MTMLRCGARMGKVSSRSNLYRGKGSRVSCVFLMDWKPLVLEWLEESRKQSEVQAMRPNGSRYKLKATERAIQSIKTNTTEIHDMPDLLKLPRVGEKTVALIKQKWAKYLDTTGAECPPSFVVQNVPSITTLATELGGQSYPFAPPPESVTTKKRRNYIPKYGSAAYYVLLAMRQNELGDLSRQGIGQSELQRLMKTRTAGVLEGAVSSIMPSVGMALKTLRDHELVYLQNARYFLDEAGRELAKKLMRASGEENTETPEKQLGSRLSGSPTRGEVDMSVKWSEDVWEPQSFSTKLVIDSREVASKNDRSGLVNDLRNLGLDLDIKALSLGDCIWVAEHKVSGRRAVLDWIIERKTLSDLRSSIHDGRYHDQKKRLGKSTVPHIVYLIEYVNNVANNEMFKENHKKFMTAMSQTLVRHDFHLKLTRSQNETVQYIYQISQLIEQKYTTKQLQVVVPNVENFEASMRKARTVLVGKHIGIDYSAFHEGLTKSKMGTVGETFITVLRAIKGISAEKALAVQRVYPTPSHLMRAYQLEPDEQARRAMVHKATSGCIRRQQIRIGLSELIYEVWCDQT